MTKRSHNLNVSERTSSKRSKPDTRLSKTQPKSTTSEWTPADARFVGIFQASPGLMVCVYSFKYHMLFIDLTLLG